MVVENYRLKHICSNEGMKTSSIALTTLAEYTGEWYVLLLYHIFTLSIFSLCLWFSKCVPHIIQNVMIGSQHELLSVIFPNFDFSFILLIICFIFTECDIRSCLNTLQFLNKKKEILNVVGFYYDFSLLN